MADLLFITPQELVSGTLIGGNVDVDKYKSVVLETQLRVIEPLLGTLLYDKIAADIAANTLAGLYLELFNDYIKPITKYESCAGFIAISPYTLSNGGLFKNSPEGAEVVSKDEVSGLSDNYSSIAQMYVVRFDKWIDKNTLTEYQADQNEVNAIKVNVNNGWYF
tara:strand:+ start:110 stop:601 length:492 start_codon:yes stop_codon:yes gene_type:complete